MAGFPCHHSTIYCIADLASPLEEARAAAHPAYVMFLDIHRALGALPHSVILQHLRLSGTSVRLQRYIWAFLSDRTFRVNVHDVLSDVRPVTQGVPLGNVLSPTLLNTVMAALPRCFPGRFMKTPVEIAIYADDIVLWSVARGKQRSPARVALQHGFNWTVRYIEEQGQQVSHDKTAMVLFSPRKRVPLIKFF